MKKTMIAGILLILVSIFLNFETSITGAVISVGQSDLNLAAVVAFLVGVCLIITSRMQITGGLEKALEENDDVVGVLSFVRHGEKDKEGNLTETGRQQARAYGQALKEVYQERGEGNLYLAASSSPVGRVVETVKGIMGVESRYNKPILKDERLTVDFKGEAGKKYGEHVKERGEAFANSWYVNSHYGEEIAEQFASFLESQRGTFEAVNKAGRKFHYIAGTHGTLVESLLKRVLKKGDRVGFEKLEDIGGSLGFAEPINFLLKRDGSYAVNFRGQTYGVDMKKLDTLVKKYEHSHPQAKTEEAA